MVIRESRGDRLFGLVNVLILGLILVVVVYPLWYVIIASVSDPDLVNSGQVVLWPRKLTVLGFKRVFEDPEIISGYRNTIFYTLGGTCINLFVTLTAAYALSKKRLHGQKFFLFLFSFTMFFSGGLIPTYLLVKSLGMINKVWALLIPGAASVYNILVARTFYQNSIPKEIEESAMIDGCSTTYMFISIIVPLSRALVAVMALFYGVGHWNAFFDALIYISNRKLFPLQLILREILVQTQLKSEMLKDLSMQEESMDVTMKLASLIRYSVIIVSTIPVMVAYPFLQRYFTQGVMLGAIKG
jgi:putative aldouronate transport system permease protein